MLKFNNNNKIKKSEKKSSNQKSNLNPDVSLTYFRCSVQLHPKLFVIDTDMEFTPGGKSLHYPDITVAVLLFANTKDRAGKHL